MKLLWSRRAPIAAGIRGLTSLAAVLAAVGIAALMLISVGHVVLRTAGGGGIPGQIEVSEIILVGVAFLGMAYAQRRSAHVGTSLLTDRLPARAARVARACGKWVMVLFVAWLLYATAERAISSYLIGESRFGLVPVPIWPARVLLALGVLVLLLETLRPRRPEELSEDASVPAQTSSSGRRGNEPRA